MEDGEEKTIGYTSRTLTAAETKTMHKLIKKVFSSDAVWSTCRHSNRSQTTLTTIKRNQSNTTSSLRTNSKIGTDIVSIAIYSEIQINMSNVDAHIYPTPPLGQDMTQGQFLRGV